MIMHWYHRFNIAQKLRLLFMIGGLISILTFSAIYTYYGMHTLRSSLLKDAVSTANLLGSRVVASIRFNNPDFAAQKLGVLSSDRSLKAICIYNSSGQKFAAYPADATCPPQQVLWNGLFQESAIQKNGQIIVHKNILADGEVIGAVRLQRSEEAVRSYLALQLKTMGIITGGCLFLGYFIANYLQKLISNPIVEIAKNAQHILVHQSFQDRIKRKSPDELGQMAEAFNNVLALMNERHQQLAVAFQTVNEAYRTTLKKLEEVVEDFREPADSFIVYTQMTEKKLLGTEISNYTVYQSDVMEALTEYHIKLHSFTRLTNLYAASLNELPSPLNLRDYLSGYASQLRETIPYLKIEMFGDLDKKGVKPEIQIRKAAWEEIFRSLSSVLHTMMGIVDFPAKLQFHLAPNSSNLEICFIEESAQPLTAPILSLCKLTELGEGAYVKNTIDDPGVAEEFLDEELFPRQNLRYILDSMRYIASANIIGLDHRFESCKFILYLNMPDIKRVAISQDYIRAV